MTGLTLITDALMEIGVQAQGEPVSAADGAFALGRLNAIVDTWNGERSQVLADSSALFTLVPALSPHTIGPAVLVPTWAASSRPVALLSVRLVEAGGSRTPLDIHHGIDWWAGQTSPTDTGTPTDVCYVPDWPLGLLYFWPVPNVAQAVELFSRVLVAAFDLPTLITLAPGYQSALMFTLAEDLCAPFGRPAPADLKGKANKARALVQRNNAPSARIGTADAGVPANGGGGWFDYQTGRVR
jgi:hypothetical protein